MSSNYSSVIPGNEKFYPSSSSSVVDPRVSSLSVSDIVMRPLQLAALLLSSSFFPCFAYNTINVYFPHSTPDSSLPPSLSQLIGLEAFETYGDLVPQAIIGKAYQFINPGKNEKQGLLMISIEAEDDHVVPTIVPASFSSISISTSSISDTMRRYLSFAENFYSPVVDGATSFVEEVTVPSRFLDTSIIASLQSKAASEFFTTLKNAIRFVEDQKDDSNNVNDDESGTVRFGSFQFRGLNEMRDSVDSDVYQMALRYLGALIDSASRSYSVAILIPSSSNPAMRRAPQPPPQSPLPIPQVPETAPIFSTSTCYSSAEVCQNSTSFCSSRGGCVAATRAQKTCFVCQCHPAPLSEGGKNISWAGDMCQKVDISQSFSLLAGTVLFLIIVIGGALALLYSIGTEPLPGTLNVSTGTTSTKKDL